VPAMGTRTRWGRLGLAAGIVALAVSCGADDREMRPPSAAQTTTSRASAGSLNEAATATGAGFTLRSDQFAQTGLIPDRYTCRGASARPPLRWTNIPADTVEMAVVVRDLDASGFVHWVVAGISPDVNEIVEGAPLPVSAVEAGNSAGGRGWIPPCPPSGTHRYEFKVYALAEDSGLQPDLPGEQAATLIEGRAARGVTALTGTVQAA
jgi:Raf kinase inhibitor-like YbhB/YbcL family protein